MTNDLKQLKAEAKRLKGELAIENKELRCLNLLIDPVQRRVEKLRKQYENILVLIADADFDQNPPLEPDWIKILAIPKFYSKFETYAHEEIFNTFGTFNRDYNYETKQRILYISFYGYKKGPQNVKELCDLIRCIVQYYKSNSEGKHLFRIEWYEGCVDLLVDMTTEQCIIDDRATGNMMETFAFAEMRYPIDDPDDSND